MDYITGRIIAEMIKEDMQEAARREEALKKNGAWYNDPTAYKAIRHMESDEDSERFHKLLHAIRDICELSDFCIVDRIVVKDKKTGKVWR